MGNINPDRITDGRRVANVATEKATCCESAITETRGNGPSDARQRRKRSRFRQEVRELRRQRARGAVPGTGGQSEGVDEGAVPRYLRRRPGALLPGTAAQNFAELPCGERSAEAG